MIVAGGAVRREARQLNGDSQTPQLAIADSGAEPRSEINRQGKLVLRCARDKPDFVTAIVKRI